MSGGIGAKKVDVTWATEQSGLILGISLKTTNFRDGRSKSFQKNLTNRRGDMLGEAVTLHRRFPYAVLAAFFIYDKDAATDGSTGRASTFLNAHHRLKLFTGRVDPAGRDEQYERFYIVLVDANSFKPTFKIYEAGKPKEVITFDRSLDLLVRAAAERDPDFFMTFGPNNTPDVDDAISPVSLKSSRGGPGVPEDQEERGEDDEA